VKRAGHPRRSIRLRLAALLTALFLILGGTLLGVSYALVRAKLNEGHTDSDSARGRVVHGGDDNGRTSGSNSEHVRLQAQAQRAQNEFVDDALGDLTTQYLGIIGAMALLSGALGWFVSGRVLRPMSEITATARSVSRESLHERIALDGPDDELKQLADTFDSMLDRLEAAFERERAFVRNASHELRTPLSVIRTEADVALTNESGDPDALRRSLEVVREAGERSERLIDALLALARADEGDHRRTEVDLSELIRKLVDGAELDDFDVGLDLRPAPVPGDAELLRTMAANLIDNAVRHNSPGGWISLRTESANGEARLEISNSGETIPAEQAAALTEPFRRAAAARTGEGLGLGLSIAATVARAHGGRLSIHPLEQGGLHVSVALPRLQ
jgi:signal transduction histidine kinase